MNRINAFHKFNLAEIHPSVQLCICVRFNPPFSGWLVKWCPAAKSHLFFKCFKIVCQTFIPEWAHYRPYKPTRTTLESISICRVFFIIRINMFWTHRHQNTFCLGSDMIHIICNGHLKFRKMHKMYNFFMKSVSSHNLWFITYDS